MARYAPLWQQAGTYAAALDRSLLNALWPSGGAMGGVVTAVAGTMNVQAAPGTVAVPLQSGQGTALCLWDANEIVTLPAAPPSGQSRIDLVILQVRDHALDAGANNDFIVTSVTGVPAASNPAAPALPTNALAIAQVLVPGAAANLNGATLTDKRGRVLTSAPPTVPLTSGAPLAGLTWGSAWAPGTPLTVLEGAANLSTDAGGNCNLDVTPGHYATGYVVFAMPAGVIGANLWVINPVPASSTAVLCAMAAHYLTNTVIASGVIPVAYRVVGA